MKLKELTGEHLLDAVDFSDEQVRLWGEYYKPCQVVRFRLDGKVYVALEDPADGYRSLMADLTIAENATMKNTFAPVKVIGRWRGEGADVSTYEAPYDILELIDVSTGSVVLEVGTDNTDYYYPYFVASFHPEAMGLNAGLNDTMPAPTEATAS